MKHSYPDCPLVMRRIACYQCGYPSGEVRYADVEDYWGKGKEPLPPLHDWEGEGGTLQWPVYEEAKGG